MNEQMIKNEPIKAMSEEVKNNKALFEGVGVFDEPEGTVIYHEACDVDIIAIRGSDMDFAVLLDQVLTHLAECDPDEEDDDPWEDLLDDEEIESL